jgi:serine/threonine-protein kinase
VQSRYDVVDSATDLDVRAQSLLGAWLRDKYRVDRVLGVGGMATVYSVSHRNGRRFALKMLHTELSLRKDVRRRFLREGYIANVVDHPGAVAVLDDDVTDDGAAFLVMELLAGETADALLARDGQLSEAVVLALAGEVLDVLSAAHENNVVHRDVKPANVFVTRTGEVKVLDFGIARLRAAESSSATGAGLALGTPAFMSPEQAMGRDIDGRSDVFSVGAMIFTLLTGGHVHEGEQGQELMVRAATEPARPLASVLPSATPEVAAIVDRALAFSPIDRWETASDMRAEVRKAYATFHASDTPRSRLAQLVVRTQAMTIIGPVSESDPQGPTAVAPPTAAGVATETPEPETPATQSGAARGGRLAWMAAAVAGVTVLGMVVLTRTGGAPSSAIQTTGTSAPLVVPAALTGVATVAPPAPAASLAPSGSAAPTESVTPPSPVASIPRRPQAPTPLLPPTTAVRSSPPQVPPAPLDPLAP